MLPCHLLHLIALVLAEAADLAANLGHQLIADQLQGAGLMLLAELLQQLADADFWVCHHRLHVAEVFEGFVDAHSIKNAEVGLVDRFAQPGGAADHLVVKDAAVHPP